MSFAMAGAGLVDTGLSLYQGLRGEQMQRDTNALNYKMWQEKLEYDKPINQRKRLEEAGLNPALMYGTGQGANLSPSAIPAESPQAVQPRGRIVDPGAIVAIQQARLIGEQTRALKRENDVLGDKPGALKQDPFWSRELRGFLGGEFGRSIKEKTQGWMRDMWRAPSSGSSSPAKPESVEQWRKRIEANP